MEEADRYEILGRAGHGGLAQVYRAHDHQLGRIVAIKRINTAEADPQEAFEKLQRESHALSALTSPYIVGVFDIDHDEDGPFVVMEYVEGETLEEVIARAPLMEEDFVTLARQALEGLIAAHEVDLLHRDIKPANIMVTWLASGRPQLKILDFGLSKMSAVPAVQTIAHSGSLMGSIYFMSPEQFGRKPLDARTDLYSLGCVFYFALTAYYPFNGDKVVEVMAAHMQGNFFPTAELRPDVNPALLRWLEQLIALDPEDRFPTAQVALDHLEAILNAPAPAEAAIPTEPAPAPPAAPVPMAVAAAAPQIPAPVPPADGEIAAEPPATLASANSPAFPMWLLVVIALLAAAIIALAVVVFMGSRPADEAMIPAPESNTG